MRYKVELTQAVRAFLNGLHEDDKQAVRVLLNAIGEAPELGDPVQTLDNVFYQKTYWLDRQRWPDGIRLFYRYWNDTLLVAVIDAGDHRTSARFPGQSIYPDER
jgi:mRNA-degrading endonuclease RelE of RelBE toxin-antitoxin system